MPALSLIAPPGVFRLLLALAVVASHLTKYDIGRLGVLLFFLLSGYWVSRVWQEKFGNGNVARFYAARILRIFPLYLLCVVAAVLALKAPVGIESWTLLGIASSDKDPLGVSWSLDIELQFYLLLPLLALNWRLTAILSLPLAAAAWFLSEGSGIFTVFNYLPAFAIGALLFLSRWKPSATAGYASLAAFAVFALGSLTMTGFVDKTVDDPFDRDIYSFIWMLTLIPYVARSLNTRSSSLDRHLGNISYPLYLVHYPIIALAFELMGATGAAKLLAFLAAGIVAVLLYILFDRPVDAWRVRLTERVARPASA